MSAYYNDNDPFVCAWLKELIKAGLITDGEVDDRSILDVSADDLRGFERVHLFAGIGGWDHALNLAGWEGPVWTGSCPCQPLSGAGLRKGHADSRHLWPAFQSLIAECKPPVVFGEQVASKDGREWLAGVRADLESMGYACGAADLPAAGVGAPHIRARLWWVADAIEQRPQRRIQRRKSIDEAAMVFAGCGEAVSNTNGSRYRERVQGATSNGNRWPTEPNVGRVANGIRNRVGRLRAYGNAIVPQVAAEFISAYMET